VRGLWRVARGRKSGPREYCSVTIYRPGAWAISRRAMAGIRARRRVTDRSAATFFDFIRHLFLPYQAIVKCCREPGNTTLPAAPTPGVFGGNARSALRKPRSQGQLGKKLRRCVGGTALLTHAQQASANGSGAGTDDLRATLVRGAEAPRADEVALTPLLIVGLLFGQHIQRIDLCRTRRRREAREQGHDAGQNGDDAK
jgi:hypothetical protein